MRREVEKLRVNVRKIEKKLRSEVWKCLNTLKSNNNNTKNKVQFKNINRGIAKEKGKVWYVKYWKT